MKAAIVQRFGEPPIYGDFRDPVASTSESLVHVSVTALSPLARVRAAGAHYSSAGDLPLVAGVDGVGRLEDGRRVYFLLPPAPFGAMAQRTVVPNGQWLELPDDLDDATAAVIANPGMSSWAALTERARIRKGETVLVNGATGASGKLAVRIARHLGAARVIALGRNEAVLHALGADEAIRLGDEPGLGAALERLFADRVDIVLDYLWGQSARAILNAAAKSSPAGVPVRFVQIGAAGGSEMAFPAAVLRSSRLEITGSGLGSVSLPGLMAAIDGVFHAAREVGLTLEYRLTPLASVFDTWSSEGPRTVYTIA